MIINPYIFQTQGGGNPGSVPTTNLRLHLESTSGVTYDGTNKINLWSDQTAYANNAFQNTTTYKPTYSALDTNMNNLPSITFSSPSYDSMQIVANSSLNFSTNGFTIYLVCSIQQLTLYSSLIQHSNDDTWSQGWGIIGANSSLRFFIQNWNNTANYVELPEPTVNQKIIVKFSWDKTTMKASYRINGVTNSISKPYSGAYTNPSYALSISSAGANLNSGFVSSKFGAVLMYSGVLTTQDELNLENYLKTKYGIS